MTQHTASITRWELLDIGVNVHALLTFQPVTLKVFPALPIVTVLSHIPGRVAKGKRDQNLLQTEFFLSAMSAVIEMIWFLSE